MNAIASFGVITGDNVATGVNLSAIKDTFVNMAVHGSLRKATCETNECDDAHHRCDC